MNDYQSVRDKSVLVHAMGHKILRPFMDFREADWLYKDTYTGSHLIHKNLFVRSGNVSELT